MASGRTEFAISTPFDKAFLSITKMRCMVAKFSSFAYLIRLLFVVTYAKRFPFSSNILDGISRIG